MLSRFGQSDGRGCVISRLLDNHLPSPCLNFQSTSSSSKSTGYTLISISFPDDFYRLSLDPTKPQLTDDQRATLKANIQLLRDAIVLFTATGAARGVGGHTGELSFVVSSKSISTIFLSSGGAYDTVPEVCILLALFEHSDKFYPVVFDEAGMFFRHIFRSPIDQHD